MATSDTEIVVAENPDANAALIDQFKAAAASYGFDDKFFDDVDKKAPRLHSQRNAAACLLATGDQSRDEQVRKLLENGVTFGDFAALTDTDLQLLGFDAAEDREELLSAFALLPNQRATYSSIVKNPAAQQLNSEIFDEAREQLQLMRSAMALTNYTLIQEPPQDVLVGEKSFASRFELEALCELEKFYNEINVQMKELQVLVNSATNAQIRDVGKRKSAKSTSGSSIFSGLNWLLLSSLATGTLAALWFWKTKRVI